MDLLELEKTKKNENKIHIITEKCVLCGKDIPISIDTHITNRKGYIEGAGQLCKECYHEIYEEKEDIPVTEEYFRNQIAQYRYMINYKEKKGYEFYKRLIDVIFCLIAIIPAILLIAIFSIAIMIESPGSPIFSQIRVGKNGKFINIHKLRSMKKDAEVNGQKWAEKDDPRITKVGKFIRKYRIDELPQLFDVLSGDLSLIGPRPEVPVLTKQFNMEIPGFVTRLMVTPGISGWAQVHGGYEITPKEKWKLDKIYIEERSIKRYWKIFYLTIKTVLTGEGAR